MESIWSFSSVEDVKKRLTQQNYICTRPVATAVYLAEKMGKPILVEGPAGVGKTELAKALAAAMGRELIRLQCYEGLDDTKALYEWEYAKQLIYIQLLKEKLGEILSGARSVRDAVKRLQQEEDVFFSEAFLLPRPLLKAIKAPHPTVLLIDEVDKAEPEFEAFLLEVLSDFQVTVPELGTIKATHIPMVVLTSNNTRELADTLRRRCLHIYMDYPSPEQEKEIVQIKVPDISQRLARQVVSFVHGLRKMDVRKPPSVGEVLDWARALVLLSAEELEPSLVEETLNIVLKHIDDLRKTKQDIHRLTKQAIANS